MSNMKLLTLDLALLAPSCVNAAVLHRRFCSFTWPAYDGDTCATFAESWAITEAQFISFNPGVVCDALEVGTEYCIEWNGDPPPLPEVPTPTPTQAPSSALPTPTITTPPTPPRPTCPSTPAGVTTPSPIQSGLTCGCTDFYQGVSGDSCWAIGHANNVPLSDLYAWNPILGTDCSNLFPGNYICIGKGPRAPTTTPPPATTSTGPYVPLICTWDRVKGEYVCPTAPPPAPTRPAAPGSTQAGIPANCNRWVLERAGTYCAGMAANSGITLARLYALNPALGNDCTGLWPGYAYCIGTA